MMKRHCLFCDEIVPITPEGDYDRYIGCACSPAGFYSLLRDSYEPIHSLPHQKKRDMLHLVSAYIRELTDCNESVTLTAKELETIVNSPRIPVSIEDKGNRLLQYLYRHSKSPGESVVIHPLSSSYNLTYSPNLQELVYIMDKLRSEALLNREGTAFQLTEKGWREAEASAGGKKILPCSVLISDEEDMRMNWLQILMPKMEQYGYLPRLLTPKETENSEPYSLELIGESKLIIADLTGQSPEVYCAAGYALGLNIPVIWSIKSSESNRLPVKSKELRPIVWDTIEDLAVMLEQRLSNHEVMLRLP